MLLFSTVFELDASSVVRTERPSDKRLYDSILFHKEI